MQIITEELLAQARDFNNGLSREERSAIFTDRMLEDTARNARYSNGRTVKETLDEMITSGGVPSFARADKIGRQYAKMVRRRLQKGGDLS